MSARLLCIRVVPDIARRVPLWLHGLARDVAPHQFCKKAKELLERALVIDERMVGDSKEACLMFNPNESIDWVDTTVLAELCNLIYIINLN